MKIAFLFFMSFFLTACVSFPEKQNCPFINPALTYELTFEYGRADINEKAFSELTSIARKTAFRQKRVCIIGDMRHEGVPDMQKELASLRVKTAGEIFLDNGLPLNDLYVILTPNDETTGLNRPVSARRIKHKVVIYTEP